MTSKQNNTTKTIIMNKNVFQVKNENDIMEIINDNLDKIIIIFYITLFDEIDKLKKYIIDIANLNKELIILYIDMLDYIGGNKLIIRNIPMVMFYYNKKHQLDMTMLDYDEINKYIKYCIDIVLTK